MPVAKPLDVHKMTYTQFVKHYLTQPKVQANKSTHQKHKMMDAAAAWREMNGNFEGPGPKRKKKGTRPNKKLMTCQKRLTACKAKKCGKKSRAKKSRAKKSKK